MITISGRSLGSKKPLFADWSTPLPPTWEEGESATLRDLIEHVVRGEVRAFDKRQHERQFLKVLTTREIDAAAEKGKVSMGQSEIPLRHVDEDAAVAIALEAFDDGLYFVFIDETQYTALDQQVFLKADSRLTFLRLTLLAGG